MPIKFYRGGSPIEHNERHILQEMIQQLQKQYEGTDDFCTLFIGYNCLDPIRKANPQIDATLIKNNGIINIEIKNYSGEIFKVTKQGDIMIYPAKHRLGKDRGDKPIAQVTVQNYTIKNFIFRNQERLFGDKYISKPDDIDIAGFIVLNKAGRIETSELGVKNKFIRVLSVNQFLKNVNDYKGRDFIKRIIPMDIDEIFIELFAETLELVKVAETDLFSDETNISWNIKIKEYLEMLKGDYEDTIYINRPEIEKYLLKDRNSILTGTPGVGKTSMLEYMVYHYAKELVDKQKNERIPCHLNLIGHENISEKVRGELGGIDLNTLEILLEQGYMWIIFDGIDEMYDFRINIYRIIDFIKQYPLTKYTIAVRKEVYENPFYNNEFNSLVNVLNRGEQPYEIRLDSFNVENAIKLFKYEMGDKLTNDLELRFLSFQDNIPDFNPLTIQMTAEIFKSAEKPTYENIGKFYEKYFNSILTREVRSYKSAGMLSFLYLDSIFTEIGGIIFNDNKKEIHIKELMNIIHDVGPVDIELYHNLIIRSGIFKKSSGLSGTINDFYHFSHHSFRDYYFAKYLRHNINSLEDSNIENLILERKEHNVLVMLVGLIDSEDLAQRILNIGIDNDLIQFVIDCWSNTWVKSGVLAGTMEEFLKNVYSEKSNGPGFVFDNIIRYRDTFGLHKFLDAVTADDLLHKIDWEVIRYYLLGFAEKNDRYLHTYRGAKVYEENIKKIKREPLFYGSCKPENYIEAQNEKGHEFYYRLISSTDYAELLPVVADNSYPSVLRAFAIHFMRDLADYKNEIDAYDKINEIIKRYRLYTDPDCDIYNWIIVSFYYEGYLEDIDQEISYQLKRSFFDDYSPVVQTKMVRFFVLPKFPDINEITFLCNIIEYYSCDLPIEVDKIEMYADCFGYSTATMFLNGDDDYVPPYPLYQFEGETYTILIKCGALYNLYEMNKVEGLKYAEILKDNGNEKIRNVAKWIIKDYKKETDKNRA